MSQLEMKVPSPGESISEVEIATWLVSDGDYVEKDQAIAEVDSDKATLELPAEAAGIITLKAEEGDTIEVGAVCCLIDTSAKAPAKKAAPAPKAEPAPAGSGSGSGSCSGPRRESHPRVRPSFASCQENARRERLESQPSSRHRTGRSHLEARCTRCVGGRI